MGIKDLRKLGKNMVVEYYNRYVRFGDEKEITTKNVYIKKENKFKKEIILLVDNKLNMEFKVCCSNKNNIESCITFID